MQVKIFNRGEHVPTFNYESTLGYEGTLRSVQGMWKVIDVNVHKGTMEIVVQSEPG